MQPRRAPTKSALKQPIRTRPNPWTHAYGWEGTLYKLSLDYNNHELGPMTRKRADDAHKAIINQLKDKKLMAMRERLILATLAGDVPEANKIQLQMKAYRGEARTHGDYGSVDE